MEYVGEGGIADIRNRLFKRRGRVTLGANGSTVIPFDPAIILPREPYVSLTARIGAGGKPVAVNVVDGTFTTDGTGAYTGVTIQGARTQDLPGGLTALNITVSLSGRKVTETGSLSGVNVDWMAF